jgi:hypothetical protein
MLSRRLTFSLLALLLLGTTLGLVVDPVEAAASKKMAGTVVFVDARPGLLSIRDDDGYIVKMTGPTELLQDLRTGEYVEIEFAEQSNTRIAEVTQGGAVATTVRQVNETDDLLRLQTTEGEIIDLRPTSAVLEDLQAGDAVQVSIRNTGS